MTTLDEMEARAQRHLDGMTVNRDAMARDVLTLVRAVRAARERQAKEHSPDPREPRAQAIDDLFGGIFK